MNEHEFVDFEALMGVLIEQGYVERSEAGDTIALTDQGRDALAGLAMLAPLDVLTQMVGHSIQYQVMQHADIAKTLHTVIAELLPREHGGLPLYDDVE